MGLFKGVHTVTRADKISNFTVNTAEYGAPVMEVLGTTRISGNVIYYDDFTAHEHKETQRTGKGGKSTNTSITYTYTVACILGLCEGPVSGIGKIWVNKEIYDYPDDNVPLTLFTGTSSQQPWAYVVGKHPDRALAYENLAYMAGVIDLGDSASMPSYNFEVKGKLLTTGDGIDVNPMDYIKYVLSKVGQSNVTIYGETDFRTYCAQADLLISTPADATGTDEAQKIVNEIANLCGAYVFWSNDSYKIVPLADRPVGTWTPDKTIRYDLTKDDFIPQNGSCVTWARKDSSEQYNRFTVEFMNRGNSYEKESVTYEDTEDITDRGVKQAPTIQAGYIYTRARAVLIAEAAARRNKIGKNQYQFKLGWAFCRLEPGDLVRITDEASGITNQVVMITAITEDASGLLSVTAISWFNDDYGAAEYDVHEVDRPEIDFNISPGDTATPVIIQPPADLTMDGLEVWIGAKGEGAGWGGCTVYVSDDNTNYRTLGQINNTARIGTLQEVMTATATECVVSCNDVLLSGTERDAERGNTLIWIGGECMSYTTATLLQSGNYQLTGLVRGQYNTTKKSHSAGEKFARLDDALLKVPFRKEDIGKRIYLKFCSYNVFGAAEQSLADVNAYSYTLQAYYIPPVTNVTAYNRYRQIQDGVARYDIVVEWTPPELNSYAEAQVWYKTNNGQVPALSTVDGVAVNQLGFYGDWIFAGSGKTQVVIPQAVVGDTYKIAVITKDAWDAVTDVDFAPYTTITVALKSEIPNTPDGFSITFGEDCVATWKEVSNSDIQFYEIRKDTTVGAETANLLARTSGTSTSVPLTSRTGTLYLYAKSPQGKYSNPAVLAYNKVTPSTPNAPTVTAKLGGMSIVAGAIPSGCNGMNVYITDSSNNVTQAHTVNNVYTYTCDAGIYSVSVAYTDIFGEGSHSASTTVTIKATVDSSLLASQAVTKEKLTTAIQNAVDSAVQSASDILTIQGDITDITSDITDITSDLTTISGDISTMQTTVGNVQSAATAIVTELNKTPANCQYTSISTLKTDLSGLSSTVSTNKSTQDSWNTTTTSNITQNANAISAVVTNLAKNPDSTGYYALTKLSADVSGLSSQVTAIVDDVQQGLSTEAAVMQSEIEQNADNISAIVTQLGKAPNDSGQYYAISQLKIQADGIASTVSTNKSTQDAWNTSTASSITQNANGISAITTKLGQAPNASGQYYAISQLKTQADSISSTVSSNKTAQDAVNTAQSAINAGTSSSGLLTKITTNTSNITQNANGISAITTKLQQAPNASGQYYSISQLKTQADSIASTVSTNKTTQDGINTTMQSSITQNANGITAIVNNLGTYGTATSTYAALGVMDDSISAIASRVTETETDIASLQVQADEISSTVTEYQTYQNAVNDGNEPSALLTRITQNASGISAIATNLNDSTLARGYTAIQVMQDGIASKCTLGEATSYFQQDHTGFFIKGSLIDIDGTTRIGNNVITENMIQSGAVTANKIDVDSLSAISANVGTLTGGSITGTTLIGSTIRNANNTFSVDSSGNIEGASINSGTINAGVITAAGFTVSAVAFLHGTVNGPGTVPLPTGYTENECIWTIHMIPPSQNSGYNEGDFKYSGRTVTKASYASYSGEGGGLEIDGDWEYRIVGIKSLA